MKILFRDEIETDYKLHFMSVLIYVRPTETSLGKISHKTQPTICHNYTKINDNLTF